MDKEATRNALTKVLECRQNGQLDKALALCEAVLRDAPCHADALNIAGCLQDDIGNIDQAIAHLQAACRANVLAYPYYYNLGNVLQKANRLAEATTAYKQAIAIKSDYAQAHNNLGMALRKQGLREESRHCFQRAIQLRPLYAEAHYNLGLEWRALGQFAAAISSYERAIALQPNLADAIYAKANAHLSLHQFRLAEGEYKKVLEIDSTDVKALNNLGSVYMRVGSLEKACLCFDKVLSIDPSDLNSASNLIMAASYRSDNPEEIFLQCQRWNAAIRLRQTDVCTSPVQQRVLNVDKRLHVGYVSADFRAHAAAYWIEPLLEGHSHSDMVITCYANSEDEDEVTERLKRYADHWVPCGALSDELLIQRIQDDEIDILVDLSGHTEGNRLAVFSRQPAPVQVSWFGFPITSGLPTIQYRFTDSIMDPPENTNRYYSESLYRLNRFYAAFKPDSATPEPGATPAIKRQIITFGSFNNFTKVTDSLLDAWSQILLAVPNSRLLIQSAGLDDTELSRRITRHFFQKGIGAKRLILRGWCSLPEYLKLGREIDIALDAFPFNGGVTTCHALWMGIPLVTWSGRSAASRVGKSILDRMGLSNLVAHTSDEYKQVAVQLATDVERIQRLRSELRGRMRDSGLLDVQSMAEEVERGYRFLWNAWCTTRL